MSLPKKVTLDSQAGREGKNHPLTGVSIGPGISPLMMMQKLKMGNIVLTTLPNDREEAFKVMAYCREHQIYIMLSEIIHRGNHSRWHSEQLTKNDLEEIIAVAGPYFLGRYAIGESGGLLYWPKAYTINAAVDAYENLPPCKNEAEARRTFVDYLRNELEYERREVCDVPLFNVESSIIFSSQTESGIDGQCVELLPGDPVLTLSAIRGASSAANLIWGVHIAMLWYGGIRLDELWLKRWKASLWTSYLFGADFIYPESGHWEYYNRGEKSYSFDSPEMIKVRRELRDLHRFAQIHTRPGNGPLSPVAVVQGEDDGHPGIWNPYAWGQYNNGEEWETSGAEKGWALFDTLFRREDLFHENVTGRHNYSGNPPCGQLDVIPPNANFSKHKALLFIGYNRMNDVLYDILIQYVRDGGHLVLWLSHFDQNEKRGDAVKLFREGDLSELCGFRVTGRKAGDVRGMKYVVHSSFREYDFPVRSAKRDPYFIGRSQEAEVELAPGGQVNVLAGYSDGVTDTLENITRHPLLIEHRLGKGVVFTVSTFSRPGEDGMRKFAEVLVRTVAKAHRTESELIASDTIRWAVYSTSHGKYFYILNTDPDLSQFVHLEYQGRLSQEILLPPLAFRVMYRMDDLLFIPSDPLTDVLQSEHGNFVFQTNEQTFAVENMGTASADFTLNGKQVHLNANERILVQCSANIPQEKKEFFDSSYLDEPMTEMKDISTPY